MLKRALKALILVALLGGTAAALTLGVRLRQWSKGATVFGEGFNREAFLHLPLGASMQEAGRMLGKPLSTETQDVPETWLYYSPEGSRALFVTSGPVESQGGLTLEAPRVSFDSASLVDSAEDLAPLLKSERNRSGERIVKGDSKAKVLALLGEPYMRRTGGSFSTWRYSKPKGPKESFEAVLVVFSPDGRLIQKSDQFMAD